MSGKPEMEDATVVMPTAAMVPTKRKLAKVEILAAPPITAPPTTPTAEAQPETQACVLKEGECRFGITATGPAVGRSHWLVDSAVCGDMLMALPSAVLIAGRSVEAGGVAVDMGMFLDAIMEGAAKHNGIDGVAEVSMLPGWAVSRLFGTFPVLVDVYHQGLDQSVLAVEAAGWKAACGLHVRNVRKFSKTKTLTATDGTPIGTSIDTAEETVDKFIPPDATLSKLILTSRMKNRYKDEGGMKQAIQINISGAEARL